MALARMGWVAIPLAGQVVIRRRLAARVAAAAGQVDAAAVRRVADAAVAVPDLPEVERVGAAVAVLAADAAVPVAVAAVVAPMVRRRLVTVPVVAAVRSGRPV